MKTTLVLALTLGLAACGSYGHRDYGRGPPKGGGDTVLICHKGKKTMELPRSSVNAHIAHGDRHGAC